MTASGPAGIALSPWGRRATSLLLFSLASNAAVLLTLHLGQFFWPEQLPAGARNLFWLASGVNVTGLLLLGLRYWPVLLFNAVPAWLLGGEVLEVSLLAASANTIEAVLGAWMILKFGRFRENFRTLRSIGALVIASLVAPLANTLLIPAYLALQGIIPWTRFGHALGHWNLANGAAILVLTPLLVTLVRREWSAVGAREERLLAGLFTTLLSFLAFNALFAGTGLNIAFLAFPAVLYVAVRFGIGETAIALGITLLMIYAALILQARTHLPEAYPPLFWFVQAITWVLAATGLLLAALSTERSQAERRSLEASLAAEKARLSALRYQINPHFLFNTLNSIRSALPLSQQVPRDMITGLADYLRTTLESGEIHTVPLSDELASVREYLRIEEYRFGPLLQTSFDIAPGAETLHVPAFLIQPLVENAIRHGLEATPGSTPCHIHISAHPTERYLKLEVANTGAWHEASRRRGTGTGLANIRRRLELLYGQTAQLHIDKPPGQVQIHVTIPL